MTITPELAQVITDALGSDRLDLHTAIPGEVQVYNPLLQTADIVLQVKRMLPGPKGVAVDETLPTLSNVPVAQWRSDSHGVFLPIPKGTTGMVLFSETSLDQWLAKGVVTSPSDVGRHTLTGGVFYPGLLPQKAATLDAAENPTGADMIVGKRGGTQLRFKGSTVEVVNGGASGMTADDFVAMAGKVNAFITAMDTAARTASYAAFTASYVAAFPVPPATVASSNLKGND